MNRNFDMSNHIRRQSNRVAAQSFITRMQSPNNESGSAPYLGISSYSIMNEVRSGSMTEYTRSSYGGCELISSGCPCPKIDPLQMIPSSVTGVQITFGSIILTWNAPEDVNYKGPYIYEITPYLNGEALSNITTTATTYKFENLEPFKPYTFKIVTINSYGKSEGISNSDPVIMPPSDVANALSGSGISGDMSSCIKYLQGNAIDALLKFVVTTNLGPTKSSRLVYLWSASIAQAWNWVSLPQDASLSSPSVIEGIKDGWDWTSNTIATLEGNNKVLWFALTTDYITSTLIGSEYTSKFTYNSDLVSSVKANGQWDNWISAWNIWLNNRKNDGSIAAATAMPVDSANWNETIVVDGIIINNISGFPAPNEWTRLTIQGKKQGYLTWDWNSVQSTMPSEQYNEQAIMNTVQPLTGEARDNEIDWVVAITHEMGDPHYDDPNVPIYMSPDLRKLQAEFWAGGPGTVSPPCMFVWFWCQYVRALNNISADKLIYSLLDLGIHLFEGGRITWGLKQKYMEARPIQEIRRRYVGKNLYSWDGSVVKGDQWTPYQETNFVTPPFADFPSGHSHFSKAFALTMANWFGDLNTELQVEYCNPKLVSPLLKDNSISGKFGSLTFKKGSSLIQPGAVPSVDTTLSWVSWDDMANSAGMSRLYGGIHCLTAHEASQTVAGLVDGQIAAIWGINKENV